VDRFTELEKDLQNTQLTASLSRGGWRRPQGARISERIDLRRNNNIYEFTQQVLVWSSKNRHYPELIFQNK